MNNYQEETRSYYQQLYKKATRRRINGNKFDTISDEKHNIKKEKKYKFDFFKRLVQELAVTFVLFVFVCGCKMIDSTISISAYKYAKNIVSYDCTQDVASYLKLDKVESEFEDAIDSFKKKIDDSEKSGAIAVSESDDFDKVKRDIIFPCNGNKVDDKDKIITGNGVLLYSKEGTDIFSSYDGVVRSIIDDSFADTKTVVVSNTDGIEIYVGGLKNIYVKEGQTVEKGEVLGKSSKIGKSKIEAIVFRILYKGKEEDPMSIVTV